MLFYRFTWYVVYSIFIMSVSSFFATVLFYHLLKYLFRIEKKVATIIFFSVHLALITLVFLAPFYFSNIFWIELSNMLHFISDAGFYLVIFIVLKGIFKSLKKLIGKTII